MDVGADGQYGQAGLAGNFGEFSKLLPVGVVLTTIMVLYFNYVFLHCLRLLQTDLPAEFRNPEDISRGWTEMGIFHVTTGMLLYCLSRCILTYPGTVPSGKGWELAPDIEETAAEGSKGVDLVEKKHTGERRHCKWCLKYKPDRCHHCRVCNVCVLRMDHHCPWVYNCIGFRNHKYFFLLIFYTVIDLIVVVFTMFDSVWWSTRVDVSVSMMAVMMFAETLATFLMVLILSFLSFHIWLMSMAMTTVEFCEKSLKKAKYDSSIYNQGTYGNICAVLGPNPLLWLLPLSLPEGDGLTWGKKGSASSSSSSGGARGSLLADDEPAAEETSAGAAGSRRKQSRANQPQAAG